jgi:hypothetical protein
MSYKKCVFKPLFVEEASKRVRKQVKAANALCHD